MYNIDVHLNLSLRYFLKWFYNAMSLLDAMFMSVFKLMRSSRPFVGSVRIIQFVFKKCVYFFKSC